MKFSRTGQDFLAPNKNFEGMSTRDFDSMSIRERLVPLVSLFSKELNICSGPFCKNGLNFFLNALEFENKSIGSLT